MVNVHRFLFLTAKKKASARAQSEGHVPGSRSWHEYISADAEVQEKSEMVGGNEYWWNYQRRHPQEH